MKITKTLLSLDHYAFTAINGDDPNRTGTPDSDLLNRQEGYEVIQIIQNVFDEMKLTDIKYIRELELLIKDKLPSDIRKRDAVKSWLISELTKSKGNRSFRELLSKL